MSGSSSGSLRRYALNEGSKNDNLFIPGWRSGTGYGFSVSDLAL